MEQPRGGPNETLGPGHPRTFAVLFDTERWGDLLSPFVTTPLLHLQRGSPRIAVGLFVKIGIGPRIGSRVTTPHGNQ